MKIKMKSLYITDYTESDIRKIKFIEELKCDPLICKYLYKDIDKSLKLSHDMEKLEYGESYLIEDQENVIGYVRLADFEEKNLELHYAVHPQFRHKGYGSRLLGEASDYLLDKFNNIKRLCLYIDITNINSIRCAKSAKFKANKILKYDDDKKILLFTKGKENLQF